MEFLIISVPIEKENHIFESVNTNLCTKHNLCNVSKFSVPQEFKVGTLDMLIDFSEKLYKLDTFSDSVSRKIVNFLADILEEERSKLESYLPINNESIEKFVLKYSWDESKFSTKESVDKTHSMLSKRITAIDDSLKSRKLLYNQIKLNLQALERKESGSLLTRNISNLVKKEQFVLGSEYLVTLAVVVSKSNFGQWLESYAKITNFIVPGSSELVYQDGDYGLWTVTMFKKVAASFKTLAKEKKFFVRDFAYDEQLIQAYRQEMSRLVEEKKKEFKSTLRILQIHFQEALVYSMHVKSLRIFVESVLRYGLPVNIQPLLVGPVKNNHKQIFTKLEKMFSYLDRSIVNNNDEKGEEKFLPDFMGESEYLPYVNCKLDMKFLK